MNGVIDTWYINWKAMPLSLTVRAIFV